MPITAESPTPSPVNAVTMPPAYNTASPTAAPRVPRSARLKYEMVIGTIGNTQGVSSDSAPIVPASHKKRTNDSAPEWECGGEPAASDGVVPKVACVGALSGAVDPPPRATAELLTTTETRTVSSVGGRQ